MRLRLLLAVLLLAAVWAAPAPGATTVEVAGDARVYGVFFANRNFTGWTEDGRQTEERLTLWQRLRVRSDFTANENLSFRFGLRIDDEAWGAGYLTAANPQVALEPYQAYLQLTWPDTRIRITAGYQPYSLPHSEVFYDSIVLAADDGDQPSAALHVDVLINERVAVQAAFARLLAANRTYQPATTQNADAFDVAQLALPVTLEGFAATPWALVGVYGKACDPQGLFDAGLRAAGSYPGGGAYPYANNQNALWWTGLTLTVNALDPFKWYFDAIFGDAAPTDRMRDRRRGAFFDAGLTYSGLDWVLPGIFVWWGSGEDASLANGSERLPVITPKWGPGTSFLFTSDQELSNNTMGLDPTGTWGLAVSFRDIQFLEALKSRLTVAAVAGTSSPAGLRKAVAASGGSGPYLVMGRNLAQGEWVLGCNWDHSYAITEQLNLILQTGFAAPQGLKTGIWGHRFTSAARDAAMVSLGLYYTF